MENVGTKRTSRGNTSELMMDVLWERARTDEVLADYLERALFRVALDDVKQQELDGLISDWDWDEDEDEELAQILEEMPSDEELKRMYPQSSELQEKLFAISRKAREINIAYWEGQSSPTAD